jgi:hypothetical protein
LPRVHQVVAGPARPMARLEQAIARVVARQRSSLPYLNPTSPLS